MIVSLAGQLNPNLLYTRDGRPVEKTLQNTIAAPPRPALPLKIPLLPHPAPPHGSGQNCGAFAGQNENHTLNFINGDDDYDDDLMMTMNVEYILLS